MTQTEWIISLDDDLKDHDELFVGNVRDGDILTRCKDCVHKNEYGYCTLYINFHHLTEDMGYCSDAERIEE